MDRENPLQVGVTPVRGFNMGLERYILQMNMEEILYCIVGERSTYSLYVSYGIGFYRITKHLLPTLHSHLESEFQEHNHYSTFIL